MQFTPLSWFQKCLGFFHGWPPKELDGSRETAWLDGVRGLAAFLVVMNHYDLEWLSIFAYAPFGARVLADKNVDGVWYYKEGDRLWEPYRLPFFRIIAASGSAEVAIFFVLSGFVLSWSPLGTIRANNQEKLFGSLSSSLIRRWFRLYLPCFIVGVFYLINEIYVSWHGVIGMFEEIWTFIEESRRWSNPLQGTPATSLFTVNTYNYVMWTIPFEFSGSIFVFTLLLAIGRTQAFHRRMVCVILTTMYAGWQTYWGLWLFGMGLALADYVRWRGGFNKLSQQTGPIARCAWILVFVLSLLLMGYVDESDEFTRPGYAWLSYIPIPPGYRGMVGEGRVWFAIAGFLFVASSCHLTFVRRFHETKLIQHLGRISFMLYLIHILINTRVSLPLRGALYDALCENRSQDGFDHVFISGPFTNVFIWLVVWLISVPIAMSCAHFLEIFVDKPCNEFGKWLDDKFVNGSGRVKLQSGQEEAGLLSQIPLDQLQPGEASEVAEPLLSPKFSLESASTSSIDHGTEVPGKG
ncbi:O-acetyltransferase PaAT-1 [Fulvia fulva]|nr:O-acetyltransferase PaAT-1 [Fulvia fulva]KAK4614893.1 O-acetyltransferase PaAT-1 [Fulvia fulva]WPV20399.1 O-acetyltransferase PaAT-1 [Fulvia fulva]WPV35312.1 O-acetyltransferase PaAT-1 [Fulvia fulva]